MIIKSSRLYLFSFLFFPPTQSPDEMAFCNRLACILTKERELPKICQGFPTVVQTVNEHAEKLQQQEIFHHTWQRNLQRTNTGSYPMPPISGR